VNRSVVRQVLPACLPHHKMALASEHPRSSSWVGARGNTCGHGDGQMRAWRAGREFYAALMPSGGLLTPSLSRARYSNARRDRLYRSRGRSPTAWSFTNPMRCTNVGEGTAVPSITPASHVSWDPSGRHHATQTRDRPTAIPRPCSLSRGVVSAAACRGARTGVKGSRDGGRGGVRAMWA
jgi:hypothetical protein